MRAPITLFLLVLLPALAAADPCPPPPSSMLKIVREAHRVRLVRLEGRERVKNPFARDTTFLGYRAMGGAELKAPAGKRLGAAFGHPAAYVCGDVMPDTFFVGTFQLGFDFDAPLYGRVRLVLLEPERSVQLHLDSGAYAEAKLSDQGLKAWHAALGEILRQRGESRADFERRMSPPPSLAASASPATDGEGKHLGGPLAIDSTRVVDLSALKKPPLVASIKVQPTYPQTARESGVDGTVIVAALVDPQGAVRQVKVVKSIPMLDSAAMDAVRQWRFDPYIDEGKVVSAWTRVPVRFSLH